MGRDPARDLQDLKAVRDFSTALLEKALGHPLPTPAEVQEANASPARLLETIGTMQRWLGLLDLAITPPLVRDALGKSENRDLANSLLRYFVFKQRHTPLDRDKADFVCTYLFRHPEPDSPRRPTDPLYIHRPITEQGLEFEIEMNFALGGLEALPIPEEYQNLLREFDFIQEEVADQSHFDQLMDSGIVERVRGIKENLGEAFYHPKSLATISAHNNFFRVRFDDLFRLAAQQIRSFAAKVQEEGGSIMSRVDGDVIVKHLTEVEEGHILTQEYGHAKEQFRKVSKMKKAVDTRRMGTGRRPGEAGGHEPAGPVVPSMSRPAPKPKEPKPLPVESLAEAPAFAVGNAIEDARTRSAVEAIRNFVRAADSNWNVVPIRDGNLVLSPAEVEAFRFEPSGERSFRADYAAILMQTAAILSRMTTELNDYLAKKESAYLWKPHADSLTYLISAAGRVFAKSTQVLQTAEQRGLVDKAKAMSATLDRLRIQTSQVAKALQS